jgi:hypothetical protein
MLRDTHFAMTRTTRTDPWLARLCAGAFVLALVGCHGGSARLEGKWRGVRTDGVAPESLVSATAFASGTEIDFHGNAITIKTPKDTQTGKYKVIREDKASIVIVTDRDGPDDKQTFTFDGEKMMKWAILEGKTITFMKEPDDAGTK